MTTRSERAERQCCEEVVTLQVWIVGKNLLSRHACRQEF